MIWRIFPFFFRNHLGKAYDQEEDPDFDEFESFSDEDSLEEYEILESDNDDVIKVKDANAEGSIIEDLSVMVEDLTIPDEVGEDDSEEEVDLTDDEETEEEEEFSSFVQNISWVHIIFLMLTLL